MMQRFKNSRVLVTGATSGIGAATAISFSREGASVLTTGRNKERGDEVVGKMKANGNDAWFQAGDLTDDNFCRDLVGKAVELMGGIDIVVNAAGIIYHATVEDTTDQQWHDTLNTNVTSVFYVCRAVLPHMKQQGGVIINIASDAALTGSEHLSAYCASKGAVLQLSRAMAKDYARHNIRVVPICPGDVDTPMLRGEFRDRGLDAETGLRESAEAVPLNRVASAQEVADFVLYASSDSARFITGYPLVMDGGNRA